MRKLHIPLLMAFLVSTFCFLKTNAQSVDTIYTNSFESANKIFFTLSDPGIGRTADSATDGNYSLSFFDYNAVGPTGITDSFEIPEINPEDSFVVLFDFYKGDSVESDTTGEVKFDLIISSLKRVSTGPAPSVFSRFSFRYKQKGKEIESSGWTTIQGEFTGQTIIDKTNSGKFFFNFTPSAPINGDQRDMAMDNIRLLKKNAGEETGVPETKNQPNVTVYPNPVQDQLTAKVPDGLEGQAITAQILNQSGQVIKVRQQSALQQPLSLNVKGLSSGIYFLHLKGNNTTYTGKFAKN